MKTILTQFVLATLALCGLSAQIKKNTDLEIRLTGIPAAEQSRINGVYQVDSSGNIRMWEIGTIRAAGLTATSLAQTIEGRFKSAQIYTSPVAIVQMSQVDDDNFSFLTVGGNVSRPGQVQFVNGMTLAQAIIQAGGPTAFGTTKRVTIFREGKRYELSPLTNDQHKLEKVYPNDTISIDKVGPFEQGGN